MDSELQTRLAAALAPAYDLDGEIGRGGMAIVYRARDTRLKRAVAVKLLPPELSFRTDIKTRFLREAEMAARLSHPNIVPIYSVDERDGLVYFVMALVEGGSVGERLRQSGVFSVDDTRRILREVADALAYAHARGVVHRDIKPDNILLDRDSGRAMVTDFGIARAASDDDSGGTRLTATGVAIGTPAYMSPEQCAGDREIDGRSDLYALGTVAYQMLTGEPPFTGGSTPAIMVKHVTETPVPLRRKRADVPEDLERIIMRLLAKEPGQRFANGGALVDALDGAPVTPLPEPRRAERTPYPPSAQPPSALADVMQTVERLRDPALRLQLRAELHGRSGRELRREVRELKRGRHLPIPARLRRFRGSVVSWLGTSAFFVGINAATNGPHGYWWCVWPIMGIGLGVVGQASRLLSDGVPFGSLFGRKLPPELAAPASADPEVFVVSAGAPPAEPDTARPGDDRDPYAAVLRQAMSDRETVHDLITRMSETEKQMLPDVQPTADALLARIVSLNAALRRVEPQLGADSLAALDAHIEELDRQSGQSSDRERRLDLLRRQREKLAELVKAHGRLLDQYESAGLMLRNLTLDLLKARSSGLDAAIGGITSATQEARALSREIGYVLSAADELKAMNT
ncbi:MAG TPA: protein kinase [Gemmatimonadaceae bacterium]|nr:protein kinase [Gemmatimonadaceae bacterium]